MKAYIGGIHSSDDAGNIIVFAQTSKEAIKLVLQDDISDYRESYIDVYAKRYPAFDGMENLSHGELMKEKWRDGWRFFDNYPPEESESSDQDFYDWYNKTFGLWEGEPK